jgi:hypothetical protein
MGNFLGTSSVQYREEFPMSTAHAATITVGLLILVLLLLPTAFGAALVPPSTAVSRIAASREGHTASPFAGEAGTGTSTAPGCVAGQGMVSSRDTGFWHDVPDRSHDTGLFHDVPDKSHDWGLFVDVCDPSDPDFGTPVAEPPTPRLADQAITP